MRERDGVGEQDCNVYVEGGSWGSIEGEIVSAACFRGEQASDLRPCKTLQNSGLCSGVTRREIVDWARHGIASWGICRAI